MESMNAIERCCGRKQSRMRILFYIDTIENEGGAERVMTIIANELCKRGHDIFLVNDYKIDGIEFELDNRIERLFLAEKNDGNPISKNVKRIHRFRKVVKNYHIDTVILPQKMS